MAKSAARRQEPRLGRRAADRPAPSARELAKIALGLFAERHYALVTIRDISRAANVNSAMIYYHFADKKALFRAAIENAIDEAFEMFEAHRADEQHANPADAISDWLDVHIALAPQLRSVVKISLDCRGVIGNIPEAHEPIKRFYRHEDEILQRSIRDGIDQGVFRAVDPAAVATMISTMLDGVMARSNILGDFDMVGTVEEIRQALWCHLGFQPTAKT